MDPTKQVDIQTNIQVFHWEIIKKEKKTLQNV